MRQVFGEVRVGHHGVLGVAEHVGLPVGRYRAELDRQRVLLLGVVLEGVVVAARPVEELPPCWFVFEITPLKFLRLQVGEVVRGAEVAYCNYIHTVTLNLR